MSRALWFVAGAASGVYAVAKVRRTVYHLTPDGIGARAAALGLGARMFADEVRSAMVTREDQLRAELGVAALRSTSAKGALPAPHDREGSVDGDR